MAYRASIDSSQPGDKVLKWQVDLNGDGHNEVFVSYKHDYDEGNRIEDMIGWAVYISNADGTAHAADVETHQGNEISYGPIKIDLDACHVGEISEIGGRGLLTQEIVNPREGDPIARIYAYKIKGGHLEVSKLAEYNAKEENALFKKYLAEGKRTVIQPVEVAPQTGVSAGAAERLPPVWGKGPQPTADRVPASAGGACAGGVAVRLDFVGAQPAE